MSEMTAKLKNQSLPKSGLSPLRGFLLYGSTMLSFTPILSMIRQRSGTGKKFEGSSRFRSGGRFLIADGNGFSFSFLICVEDPGLFLSSACAKSV